MVLLHGWMDVSASFQFVVDALERDWDVYAPDWRGYGLTAWAGSDSYWFADYLADLDFLLEKIAPEKPLDLVGHSMGGHVGGLYAGVRPARVARFVNLEGFGLAVTRPDQAPTLLRSGPPRRSTPGPAGARHDDRRFAKRPPRRSVERPLHTQCRLEWPTAGSPPNPSSYRPRRASRGEAYNRPLRPYPSPPPAPRSQAPSVPRSSWRPIT